MRPVLAAAAGTCLLLASLLALSAPAQACKLDECNLPGPVDCNWWYCEACVTDADGNVRCVWVPIPCSTSQCF